LTMRPGECPPHRKRDTGAETPDFRQSGNLGRAGTKLIRNRSYK
jgi:hypothetical protein